MKPWLHWFALLLVVFLAAPAEAHDWLYQELVKVPEITATVLDVEQRTYYLCETGADDGVNIPPPVAVTSIKLPPAPFDGAVGMVKTDSVGPGYCRFEMADGSPVVGNWPFIMAKMGNDSVELTAVNGRYLVTSRGRPARWNDGDCHRTFTPEVANGRTNSVHPAWRGCELTVSMVNANNENAQLYVSTIQQLGYTVGDYQSTFRFAVNFTNQQHAAQYLNIKPLVPGDTFTLMGSATIRQQPEFLMGDDYQRCAFDRRGGLETSEWWVTCEPLTW